MPGGVKSGDNGRSDRTLAQETQEHNKYAQQQREVMGAESDVEHGSLEDLRSDRELVILWAANVHGYSPKSKGHPIVIEGSRIEARQSVVCPEMGDMVRNGPGSVVMASLILKIPARMDKRYVLMGDGDPATEGEE